MRTVVVLALFLLLALAASPLTQLALGPSAQLAALALVAVQMAVFATFAYPREDRGAAVRAIVAGLPRRGEARDRVRAVAEGLAQAAAVSGVNGFVLGLVFIVASLGDANRVALGLTFAISAPLYGALLRTLLSLASRREGEAASGGDALHASRMPSALEPVRVSMAPRSSFPSRLR
jgi:hypothetical protein